MRIGATDGAGSAPIINTVAPWFHRKHPDVELRFRVDQPTTVDEWIADGHVDLAVTFALDNEVLPDDIVLSSEDLVWTHSPDFDIAELNSVTLVTWGARSFSAQVGGRVLTEAGIDHHVAYELPSSAAVWSAIANGAGVTVADRAEIDQADIATTGPPVLPDLPQINYVLRRNPTAANTAVLRLVADQIQASFEYAS